MKFTFYTAAFFVMTTTSFAAPDSLKTLMPFSLNDIGVVGPNGDVRLYYKEGNDIIVKSCKPLSVLGKTSAEAKSKCSGKTSKVPVEIFKQLVKKLVSKDGLIDLKPITDQELSEYRKPGKPSTDEIDKTLIELEEIKCFLAAYGDKASLLVRKKELERSLENNGPRVAAIKNINKEIENVLLRIADNEQLTIANSNAVDCEEGDEKIKSQFMYTVLKKIEIPVANDTVNPVVQPCGLIGSIDERVSDCSAAKGNFTLVSRTEYLKQKNRKEIKEIYKDNKNGLIWSDLLPAEMDYSSAKAACESLEKIDGKSWRLPLKEEYEEAFKNGMRDSLPNMFYKYFWSSVPRDDSVNAWLFSGASGSSSNNISRNYHLSVRCVAR